MDVTLVGEEASCFVKTSRRSGKASGENERRCEPFVHAPCSRVGGLPLEGKFGCGCTSSIRDVDDSSGEESAVESFSHSKTPPWEQCRCAACSSVPTCQASTQGMRDCVSSFESRALVICSTRAVVAVRLIIFPNGPWPSSCIRPQVSI